MGETLKKRANDHIKTTNQPASLPVQWVIVLLYLHAVECAWPSGVSDKLLSQPNAPEKSQDWRHAGVAPYHVILQSLRSIRLLTGRRGTLIRPLINTHPQTRSTARISKKLNTKLPPKTME